MQNKTMLIVFPAGNEAATAEKIMLISAYLAGEADIVFREPDEDENDGLDGIGPANIRFRFAGDEDGKIPPY
jgi:hypothetical protein